jgi:hypothetical protein
VPVKALKLRAHWRHLKRLQGVGRAVLDDRRAVAVRASRVLQHARFDDFAHLAARAQRAKSCRQLLALVVRQLGQTIDQARHLLLSHGLLLGATPQRHASKMRAVGRKKSAYHQHSREEPQMCLWRLLGEREQLLN